MGVIVVNHQVETGFMKMRGDTSANTVNVPVVFVTNTHTHTHTHTRTHATYTHTCVARSSALSRESTRRSSTSPSGRRGGRRWTGGTYHTSSRRETPS